MGIAIMKFYEHYEHACGGQGWRGKKFVFSLFRSVFWSIPCSFCFILFINLNMRNVYSVRRHVFMNIMKFYELGKFNGNFVDVAIFGSIFMNMRNLRTS